MSLKRINKGEIELIVENDINVYFGKGGMFLQLLELHVY